MLFKQALQARQCGSVECIVAVAPGRPSLNVGSQRENWQVSSCAF